jgi:LIVCS family branched-chain amino acid:cation transporter
VEEKSRVVPILIAAFAIFSMFFGSGNLVFPLILGRDLGQQCWMGGIGWTITAIGIPLVGLLGSIRFKGSIDHYFKILRPTGIFLLNIVTLGLIGPFGVIPRCSNVSFGGVSMLYPSCELWMFSLLFFLFVGIFAFFKDRIVDIIGIILTPFKLGGVAILIIIGLMFCPSIQMPSQLSHLASIKHGMVMGYQTMDLLGSVYMGGTILHYFTKRKNPLKSEHIMRQAVASSLVAGALLFVVYVGFIILSASYADSLQNVAPEKLLLIIAEKSFGSTAVVVVALTLFFSCLATATYLCNLWTDFMQKKILQQMLSYTTCLLITLVISFSLSLLGFQKIMEILGGILEWVYPLLIVFGVYRLFSKTSPKEVV